jgi:pre-mRNA-splicing factor RBM22/SLT11
MTEKGFGIRSGAKKEQWEKAEFPILCEVCLGENPYVRMTKKEWDRECKTWQKPFTVFRWRPGHRARFKKTEIWQACARSKNVWQTCIFDLEFGLPVAVRDKFLKDWEALGIKQEEVSNRELTNPEMKDKLALLVKKYPSYKRNQAHICSFFVKGECHRGDNCPYRHEMPEEEEVKLDENGKKIKNLSVEQSIRDRFNGVNDSLANKMISKIKKFEKPNPPENKKITTLFIGGVEDDLSEADILEFFTKYGKIKGMRIRQKSKWAFICFEERSSAEIAIDHLFSKLYIKEKQLKLLWAKDQLDPRKQNKRSREESKDDNNSKQWKLVIDETKNYYPSMDPANYVSLIFQIFIGRINQKIEQKIGKKDRVTISYT